MKNIFLSKQMQPLKSSHVELGVLYLLYKEWQWFQTPHDIYKLQSKLFLHKFIKIFTIVKHRNCMMKSKQKIN